MEVADSIVVMAEGKVQQVGTPDELYEKPASDFVMSFLGPVTKLKGQLVRPHDLVLSAEATDGAVPAIVERVVRLGFEVRVDATVDGEPIWAQVTRYRAQLLALKPGDTVYVRVLERVDVPVG